MKVCTDACIFGAYIDIGNANNMLDIGTGTGLLPLMLAQRSHLSITAVEIDREAALQAEDNIDKSPWKQNIKVVNLSIQTFSQAHPATYDLIVSNPPFFQNNLKSPDNHKNKAKHDVSLTFTNLLTAVKQLLAPGGCFWVLLPAPESVFFEKEIMDAGFHLHKRLQIKNTEKGPLFRVISCYSMRSVEKLVIDQLAIKEGNDYTHLFKELLKPYYLAF